MNVPFPSADGLGNTYVAFTIGDRKEGFEFVNDATGCNDASWGFLLMYNAARPGAEKVRIKNFPR